MKKITQLSEKKQPKVKVEMAGKGLTIYGCFLLVLNFMKAFKFREKVRKEVGIDRSENAKYEMVDVNRDDRDWVNGWCNSDGAYGSDVE